jgi:hypothetical protein
MAKWPKVTISVLDIDVVKDLIKLTKDLFNELEGQDCYPPILEDYRDRIDKLIK